MAEAIIGPLVGKLQDVAVGEARLQFWLSTDIQRFRDKLMWVRAFIREADTRRHTVSDEITKVWMQQTRDAVFDAEDALDHYNLRVDKSRYPRWARPTMQCLATFTTEIPMRHSLSRKIEEINTRLDDIIENKDKYKMDNADMKADVTFKPSTRASIIYTNRKLDDVHDSDVVVDVKELQDLEHALVTLTEQEERNHNPVVITVFGESGIGKTTLVRYIYNRMEKKKDFDVQAMESFAPYLTATNILQQIIQHLTTDDMNCPKEMVREMLEEKLRNKKYLLVIDGEVSGTEWKNILTSLPFCTRGSRVVHITQGKPHEPPSKYHHVTIQLKKLKYDDSMSLFQRRLPQKLQDKKIRKYQKDICEITQGLPLAVVLLSGLLHTKEFPSEWVKVFSYLKSKEESTRLDSILSVCFDDLPHELKCCFLYFAALPTNTPVDARNLVFMWAAEGFLRPKAGKTMEKIGFIYLNELIHRKLVNPEKMDDNYSFGSMFVKIQNKVHDFLLVEAREASFVEVRSGNDTATLTSARRLSLQNRTDKYEVLANPLPKLRTIIYQYAQEPNGDQGSRRSERSRAHMLYLSHLGKATSKVDIRSHIKELIHGSEFLRVLNLQGIEIGEILTSAIGNVVHLQYLRITSCSLKYITPTIGRLGSLQTLDVRETNVRELPKAFWMIKTLRHVLGFVLQLPKQIGNLKQLVTLDSINLEVLDLALDGTLGEMVHLEFLSIWHIAGVNVAALSGALEKLESLRTLILHGEVIPSNVFTTFSLRRIKFLFLSGDLLHSSDLDGSETLCLPNLIMLSLEKTNVTQEFINKLSELPFLATIALYPGSYKEKKLVFSSSKFQRLKKIKIIDVEVLDRVEVDVPAVPELKKMEIHSHYTGCHHDIDVDDVNKRRPTRFVVDLKKKNDAYEEVHADTTKWYMMFT